MTVETADSQFYFRLMSLIAFECRTPTAGLYGAARTLLNGDDEHKEQMLELICEQSERLSTAVRMLSLASWTALGVLDSYHLSTANTREIADRAQARMQAPAGWFLGEDGAAKVRVSGDGATVLADEAVEAGLASIVYKLLHHRAGLWMAVDGPELTISPVTADEDVRRFLVGDDPDSGAAGLTVRVIRALGGSVDLDGDTLRLHFPEPPSSAAAR